MRIPSTIAVCAFVWLASAQAHAEVFTSVPYDFSAEFPGEVTVGEPQGSETDNKGKFIAQSVIIQSRVMGVWTAMVMVDSYTVSRKINAGTTLTMMPKMFAAQLDATVTSSKPGTVGPYKARFFSFRTNDKSTTGKGIVVVVPSARPRTYQVLTSYTGLASAENIADLDKFLASFKPD